MENKKAIDEIMKKETETVDVVKNKPESVTIHIVVKEEQADQTLVDYNKLTAESEMEAPVMVMEEVADDENSVESAEKVKHESGEKKEGDQVEQCVVAVNDKMGAVEDVAGEVKEEISVETAEKEDVQIDDEASGKHEDEIKDVEDVEDVEDVSADVAIETTEVKVPEVESEDVEVKADEKSETEVEFQVTLEEKIVETKFPDEVVLISQDLVSGPKKETKEVANLSPAGFVEKISAEVKHVKEEPSKDEEENESKDKDAVKKALKEDESIKEDTLKQPDTGSKEKEIAEGLETEREVKASSEAKQETKEVGVKPKHSNNIMSKVKQSFVKVKKAIIGKSPSSKTISTEAKEEIKVK